MKVETELFSLLETLRKLFIVLNTGKGASNSAAQLLGIVDLSGKLFKFPLTFH